MIQVVIATECQISPDNTTWINIKAPIYEGCIDEDQTYASIQNLLSTTEYHIRCRNTTTTWGYLTQRTTAGVDGNMGSLAIAVFFIVCSLGFLVTPFLKQTFSTSEVANLIIRRGFWVVGIYCMMLTSVIMADIDVIAGLGVKQELFTMMWLFGLLGYGMMAFMVIKTLFDILKIINVKKTKKRMGEEDYD